MPVGTAQGLITRCPACATAFRASAEHLATGGGLVRCGRCGTLFHAQERAVRTPEAEQAAAHESAEQEWPALAEPAAPAEPSTPDLELPSIDAPIQADQPLTASTQEPTLEVLDLAAAAEGPAPAVEESVPAAVEPVSTAEPEPSPFTDDPAVAAELEPGEPEPTEPEPEPAAAQPAAVAPDLDFGRKPPRARLSPWLSIPALLLLVAVLLGQAAYAFRADVLVLFPKLRPGAERLCLRLGCDLPSPRRADLMSIESSDLQADTTNQAVMVLSATLRNKAPFPQAQPALELTLTDSRDQPVARRVLLAADYTIPGVQNNVFPANSELPVKVYFEASSLNATGYRLYLFYP